MKRSSFLCFLAAFLFLETHPLLFSQEDTEVKKGAATEEQLRLQIFLDSRNFRPGKLDGYQGEFTDKALERLSASSGMSPEAIRSQASAPETVSFTEYIVRDNDFRYVNTLPSLPQEKAKLKFLPYASMAEMVAERYHTDLAYLRRLNEGKNLDQLKAGEVLKVPAVEPFDIEAIWPDPEKAEKTSDKAVPKQVFENRKIKILRADHLLEVWEGERLLASFPISVGPPQNETPSGEHRIVRILQRPTFRYDEKMLKEGVRGDEAWNLPSGPNNPVGAIWIALSKDGIGIHGTDNPDMIGRNISSGCIRLSNWDIVVLSGLVGSGTPVFVE